MTWDQLEAAGQLAGLEWEYVPGDECPECQAHAGERLATLVDVYRLLPEFGENPACTARPCACTALPVRAN